jgi:hypothetical protein
MSFMVIQIFLKFIFLFKLIDFENIKKTLKKIFFKYLKM